MYLYELPELRHEEGDKYIIYGVSRAASDFYLQIQEKHGNDSISFFMESKPKQQHFMGRKVINPEYLTKNEANNYKYLITSKESKNAMIDTLVSKGVKKRNILTRNEDDCNFKLHESIDGLNEIKSICFYPKIESDSQLNSLITKIKWNLPKTKFMNVKIKICSNHYAYSSKEANIIPVLDKDMEDHIVGSDMILVWDKDKLSDEIIIKNKMKVYCIDPNFFWARDSAWSKLSYLGLSKDGKKHFIDISKENYNRMLKENSDKKIAYIFGTGPSIEKAFDFDYEDGFAIVCNGIANNEAALDHIKPKAIALIDNKFFNNDEYNIIFMEKAIEMFNKYKFYFITRLHNIPVILNRYPDIGDYVIGLEEKKDATEINFPTMSNFYTKTIVSNNVLTNIMLPVASSVAEEVYIIGCDGSNNTKSKEWNNNHYRRLDYYNYKDQERICLNMQKSFYENGREAMKYNYFDKHEEYLGDIINYGEKKGKKYRSLTVSNIPALKKRLLYNDGSQV